MPKDENKNTVGKLNWPPEKTFSYELELGKDPLEISYEESREKESEKGR